VRGADADVAIDSRRSLLAEGNCADAPTFANDTDDLTFEVEVIESDAR
jgi:hypothetical protein